MEKEEWDEVTVPTDRSSVDYRQQVLPPSLQILNPRQKFPISCFPHHLLLNYLCKYRFRWRPFEVLATACKREVTTSFPWQCANPAGKEVQSCAVHLSLGAASFLNSLHFHFPCLWAIEASHALLHVAAQVGHTCRVVLQAPLSIRRHCSTVSILARAYPCPGLLPN